MHKRPLDEIGKDGSFDGTIMTVNGPISPQTAGLALPHEHVMSTFGAPSVCYPYYDVERLVASVMPYLAYVKELGCQTIVDCTAAFFGRHPELLQRLASDSGLFIPVTGTTRADRLPLNHALDLRVDKTFVFDRWLWMVYLDVKNVYNHRAKELVVWSYDYTEHAYVEGMPIMPALGTRIEF